MKQINKKQKNGSWTLCSEYLEYRREGGDFSPETWNAIQKEIFKQAKYEKTTV